MISSSVMASVRLQSLPPLERGSPGFTVTRVVTDLLMFCGLPGRYDPAGALAAERRSDEERPSRSHPDDLDTLLVMGDPGRDLLEAVRIFEGCDRVHKIYAMLTNVLGGFALVPF